MYITCQNIFKLLFSIVFNKLRLQVFKSALFWHIHIEFSLRPTNNPPFFYSTKSQMLPIILCISVYNSFVFPSGNMVLTFHVPTRQEREIRINVFVSEYSIFLTEKWLAFVYFNKLRNAEVTIRVPLLKFISRHFQYSSFYCIDTWVEACMEYLLALWIEDLALIKPFRRSPFTFICLIRARKRYFKLCRTMVGAPILNDFWTSSFSISL